MTAKKTLIIYVSLAALAAAAALPLFWGGGPGSAAADSGEFTVVVLPDTQHYSARRPDIFMKQTMWVRENVADRNIVFVAHVGDVVHTASSKGEWDAANASMSVLDGAVPYGIAPGNHDLPLDGYFNTYFPPNRYLGERWYGGSYGVGNSYQLFSAGGEDYIVLNLEFCPKKDVLDWAGEVLAGNRGRKAVVVTHGFLNTGGGREVHGCGSTQYIWDELVVPNENVFMVLCGHVHGTARRSDVVGSRVVYQILADYQSLPEGGGGWLRTMTFRPAEGIVHVETYSPHLRVYDRSRENDFTLKV